MDRGATYVLEQVLGGGREASDEFVRCVGEFVEPTEVLARVVGAGKEVAFNFG